MRKKLYYVLAVLLMSALLSGCASAAYAQSAATAVPTKASSDTTEAAPAGDATSTTPRTLSVNGSGKAYLTPDIAYVSIGVHTEGKNAAEAVADNNSRSQKVIDSIKGMGVDAKDIQTTNFSIYPQQQYDVNGQPTGEINYVVDNTVVVTVRDLDKIGDLLDQSVKSGANSISGISFDVADKTAALSEARKAAVDSARSKATELAGAAGVSLGAVQTISEYTGGGPTPMYEMRAAAPMMADAASVPVQAGQMLITVEVSIVYEIR